ncbi:MAG TPA: protein kinase, partial [Polyangiaceae bacterium]|nr:protein kinase [Polyangiaceae bacterium]
EAARRLTWFGFTPPVGTPDYMAPEQVRGRRGDVRTDIYALGTMLYEMVTGQLPYTGANIHAVMRAKLNEDPQPPHEVVSDVDPKIEEIILRAIERRPRDRYATATEMLADLQDPSRVVPRDPSLRSAPPLLERLHVPRRILVPGILGIVIATLLALTWMMGQAAGRRDRRVPLPPHVPSEGR